MQIVASLNPRSGGWIAREPDKMASGRGDTAEEATADYCRLIGLDVAQIEEFSRPGQPADVRTFRTRAAA